METSTSFEPLLALLERLPSMRLPAGRKARRY